MRWLVVVAIAGCSGSHPAADAGPTTVTKHITQDLDLLFVIANDPEDEQTVLAKDFTNLVAALDAFPGGRPNLHVGVVSTTIGLGTTQNFGPNCPSTAPSDDGLLQNTARVPGCTPPTGRYIADIAGPGGTRTTNYAGTLDSTLSCIAQLGTAGCGFIEPLEAIKRALDGSRPENAGFLRPSADLAIVVLADEDDCSADPALYGLGSDSGPGNFRCTLYGDACDQPISATAPATYTGCAPRTGSYLRDSTYYLGFLATVKELSQVVVAVIAGDPSSTIQTQLVNQPFMAALALQPSCTFTNAMGQQSVALPALRLADFVGRFGERGLFRSVCQADYSGTVADIAALVARRIGGCLDDTVDPTDVDPVNPGVQLACTLAPAIPPCPMVDAATPDPAGARPCYWIAPDPSCASKTNLAIRLLGASLPVDVTCRLAP